MKVYVSSIPYHLVQCNLHEHELHEIPSSRLQSMPFAIINYYRVNKYHCVGEEILKFEGFDKISIPDHAAIFNSDIGETFINGSDLLDTFLQ